MVELKTVDSRRRRRRNPRRTSARVFQGLFPSVPPEIPCSKYIYRKQDRGKCRTNCFGLLPPFQRQWSIIFVSTSGGHLFDARAGAKVANDIQVGWIVP